MMVVFLSRKTVDPFWFEQSQDSKIVRASSGVADGDVMLVSVARVEKRKGHDLILAAVGALPEALRQRLVVVSVGPVIDASYAATLDELSEEYGVRFLRKGAISRESVRDHYAAADFACLPGKADRLSIEGFGLVFLEGNAQGTPAIASRLGGMSEAVVDGKTGLVVEPDNPQALATAIVRMATDLSLRTDLGREARESAARYTWRQTATRTYGP